MAAEQPPEDGVVVIDKPAGVTSRDVVDRVGRLLGTKAVGHAGTLDPLATGVMVVCIGRATKLVDFVHQCPKQYAVTFQLGRSSPSDDLETEVCVEPAPVRPALELVESAAADQRGDILQRPCAYSAKKVDGKRAYRSARKGQPLALEPKMVRIERLAITRYDWPRLDCEVTCSTGTFIRAIGRDLAAALGTTAVMERLVRTAVGPFELTAAIPLPPAVVSADLRTEFCAAVQPPLVAVSHLGCHQLDEAALEEATWGRHIDLPVPVTTETLAAVGPDGSMVGILRRLGSGSYRLRPNFRGRS